MKALSLRQPYAELILQGKKTMESRPWNTVFRGEFLIHASTTVSSGACKRFEYDPKTLLRGFVVGKATLVDVKEYATDEDYLEDSDKHLGSKQGLEEFGWVGREKYGFVLERVERIKPIELKGKLGFFDVDLNLSPRSNLPYTQCDCAAK